MNHLKVPNIHWQDYNDILNSVEKRKERHGWVNKLRRP
jgi:hypothetical protein